MAMNSFSTIECTSLSNNKETVVDECIDCLDAYQNATSIENLQCTIKSDSVELDVGKNEVDASGDNCKITKENTTSKVLDIEQIEMLNGIALVTDNFEETTNNSCSKSTIVEQQGNEFAEDDLSCRSQDETATIGSVSVDEELKDASLKTFSPNNLSLNKEIDCNSHMLPVDDICSNVTDKESEMQGLNLDSSLHLAEYSDEAGKPVDLDLCRDYTLCRLIAPDVKQCKAGETGESVTWMKIGGTWSLVGYLDETGELNNCNNFTNRIEFIDNSPNVDLEDPDLPLDGAVCGDDITSTLHAEEGHRGDIDENGFKSCNLSIYGLNTGDTIETEHHISDSIISKGDSTGVVVAEESLVEGVEPSKAVELIASCHSSEESNVGKFAENMVESPEISSCAKDINCEEKSDMDIESSKLLQSDSQLLPILSDSFIDGEAIEFKGKIPGDDMNLLKSQSSYISPHGLLNSENCDNKSSEMCGSSVTDANNVQSNLKAEIDLEPLRRSYRWFANDIDSPVVSSTFNNRTGVTSLKEQQENWLRMFHYFEFQHEQNLNAQYQKHRKSLEDVQSIIADDIRIQQENFNRKLEEYMKVFEGKSPSTTVDPNALLNTDLSVIASPRQVITSPRQVIASPEIELRKNELNNSPDVSCPTSQGLVRKLEKEFHDSNYLHNLSTYNDDICPTAVKSPLVSTSGAKINSFSKSPPISNNAVPPEVSSFVHHIPQELSGMHDTNRHLLQLHEKHAKNLTDLRQYYEAELKSLRELLKTNQTSSKESLTEAVTQKTRDLLTSLYDSTMEQHLLKRKNTELETRLHELHKELEDRNWEYGRMKQELSQLHKTLTNVKEQQRYDEIAHDKLIDKNEQLSHLLQESYQIQDDQLQERKLDSVAYNKLLAKFESVVAENNLNKALLERTDSKLLVARREIDDLKRKIRDLELGHNNEAHDHYHAAALISGISPSHHSSARNYQSDDSPFVTDSHRAHVTSSHYHMDMSGGPTRSFLSRDESSNPFTSDLSPAASSRFSERSPIMKAEKDIKELRASVREKIGKIPSFISPRAVVRSRDDLIAPDVSNIPSPDSTVTRAYSTPEAVTVIDSKNKNSGKNTRSPRLAKSDSIVLNNSHKSNTQSRNHLVGKLDDFPTKDDNENTRRSRNDHIEIRKNLTDTLNNVKSGKIISRPAWENVETSVAKPSLKSKDCKSPKMSQTKEENIKSHLKTIEDLENTYKRLQQQKVKLEAALSKVPTGSKASHKARVQEEALEEELDAVEKDIGSVRMSLKRYHVIKSTL